MSDTEILHFKTRLKWRQSRDKSPTEAVFIMLTVLTISSNILPHLTINCHNYITGVNGDIAIQWEWSNFDYT